MSHPAAPTGLRCVCIAGAGSLGASLGLALRALPGEPGQGRPRVVGWDRDPDARDAALALGAFDATTAWPHEEVAQADLLVAAVQGEQAVVDVARRYGPHLPEGGLFLDLSRVHAGLEVAARAAIPPRAAYLPASRWGARLEAPHAAAFRGATLLLGEAAPRLDPLWAALKVTTRRVAPADMDVLYAAHIQLPLLQRAAWVTTLAELGEVFGALWGLGGPELHPALLQAVGPVEAAELDANREALMSALGRLASVTDDMKTWLEQAHTARLRAFVDEARAQVADLAADTAGEGA